MNKIAILNTGSELIRGDILNTNGQYAANLLQEEGFSIGMHLLVTDDLNQMVDAFQFLLDHHAVVIVTGGLGPTSDDVTRLALSEVFQTPLVFYPDSWERIVGHFKKRQLDCPENNRVQALFPEKAKIFPNPYGTADGCAASKNEKWAYLLPGPPYEFQPMLNNFVLPHLRELKLHQKTYKESWLLMNVSESHIAHILDPLISQVENTELAYRVHYPYLEVKLRSTDHDAFLKCQEKIEHEIQTLVISKERETASLQLKQYIKRLKKPLYIEDHATGGLLEANLLDVENYDYLHFYSHHYERALNPADDVSRLDRGIQEKGHDVSIRPTTSPFKLSKAIQTNDEEAIYIYIEGLEAYWKNFIHPTTSADVRITIEHHSKIQQFKENVRVQTNNPRLYAMETCAFLILSYLKKEYTYG